MVGVIEEQTLKPQPKIIHDKTQGEASSFYSKLPFTGVLQFLILFILLFISVVTICNKRRKIRLRSTTRESGLSLIDI